MSISDKLLKLNKKIRRKIEALISEKFSKFDKTIRRKTDDLLICIR